MLAAQSLLGREAALDVAAHGPQAGEYGGAKEDDQCGDQLLRQRARGAVGEQLQHQTITRRVEGNDVAAGGRRAGDLGFARQDVAVAVEDAYLVLLGKPPRHELFEHRVERVDGDQRAPVAGAVEDRVVVLELGDVADAVGVGVVGLAHLLGDFGGPGLEFGVALVGAEVGQTPARDGVDQLQLLVQPQQLHDLRVGLDEVFGAQLEECALAVVGGKIVRQLLDLLGVAFEAEVEALLEPERVGDQR